MTIWKRDDVNLGGGEERFLHCRTSFTNLLTQLGFIDIKVNYIDQEVIKVERTYGEKVEVKKYKQARGMAFIEFKCRKPL